IAEKSPPKSQAEMAAMAQLPGVESREIPGSLALHEEFAADLASAIESFI
ncbi:MAG: alpha/beta hydrolase, partial [Oscillatoriales cyanobacterium RU_3_3]|nr:alpha/beta hydrolase [Oscillatoriales cyanobacterium RU_3_3]